MPRVGSSKTGVGTAQAQVDSRLLYSLTEELKLPLMQIARAAELGRTNPSATDLAVIETTADAALRLLDSYALSTQFAIGQQMLDLQPVSISAALYDVAMSLQKFAKLYNCTIDIEVSNSCGLIMAHPGALQSMITSLGLTIIGSAKALAVTGTKPSVVLSAGRSSKGITAGVLTSDAELSMQLFKRAKQLHGHARQAMPGVSFGSGAGIFIADSLAEAMASKLATVRRHKLSGFAATFSPSQQLALL